MIKGNRKWVPCCAKRVAVFLLSVVFVCSWSITTCSAGDTIGDAKKGVVCIFTTDSIQSPGYCSTGSGFGIGTIGAETDIYITNRHVVFNEDSGDFCKEIYILLNDTAVTYRYTRLGFSLEYDPESMVKCDVLYPSGDDPEYPDFAILKAERPVPGREALPMVSSQDVPDGSVVHAIGYPGSADEYLGTTVTCNEVVVKQSADIESSTMTSGILSRKLRFPAAENTWVLQHEAHIDHGNSGGPLLTERGDVAGINTYGVNGYNVAVFTDYVMNKLDELGIPYNIRANALFRSPTFVLPICLMIALAVAVLILRKRCRAFRLILSKETVLQTQERQEGQKQTLRFRLQGVSGYFASRRFPIEGTIRLGRDPENNDLVYPKKTQGISGKHCRLIIEDGKLFLEDLGSSYGTCFKNCRLQKNQRVELQAGDTFYLGQPSECFRIDLSGRR